MMTRSALRASPSKSCIAINYSPITAAIERWRLPCTIDPAPRGFHCRNARSQVPFVAHERQGRRMVSRAERHQSGEARRMRGLRPNLLVGESVAMVDLKAEIERVARSDAKVLITGESGSGKELVAQAIHNGSARSERAFVAVNCAGLPETLLESELFGHVRGSFTGAYRDKLGKLELADHGTMFLDEIGEMTLRMQGLLLRFLETGELQKVGADRVAGRANVRVVAATNKHLRDMIVQATFREDLFYRLNVIHLTVPPLRERREDIPVLTNHFLRSFADHTYAPREISSE